MDDLIGNMVNAGLKRTSCFLVKRNCFYHFGIDEDKVATFFSSFRKEYCVYLFVDAAGRYYYQRNDIFSPGVVAPFTGFNSLWGHGYLHTSDHLSTNNI